MMMNVSQHCSNDRLDRLISIIMEIGVGEIIHVFPSANQFGPTEHCVTNTGVLIIRSPKDGKMITGFMLTTDRAVALYRSNGMKNPPVTLMKTIQNNEKKRKHLFEK